MNRCTRAACRVEIDERHTAYHRDTKAPYCIKCARKINEAAGEKLVPWTLLPKKKPG